ncbi:hypothetical protein ACHQM5_024711 [Ranunculus cassubicifolius]
MKEGDVLQRSTFVHHNQTTNQLENNTSQIHAPLMRRQFSHNNFSLQDGNTNTNTTKKPPSYPHNPPYSQLIPLPPHHSRSLSQPAFFNFDNLPPLSPLPSSSTSISDTVSADEDRGEGSLHPPPAFARANSFRGGDSLPPRKAHRRSNSDIPFGFSASIQALPPLVPPKSQGVLDRSLSQLVKKEDRDGKSNAEGMGERKCQGEVTEDIMSTYMNLDSNEKNIQENGDDLDSRASGTKTIGTDSSENEAESSMHMHGSGNCLEQTNVRSLDEKREGTKRNAAEDSFPSTRHCRSVSMDSFMGNLPSFGGESLDGTSGTFSLEFGNGEFNAAELKKIMANEKLAEIALIDPKRVKRILANRQSAARSKERKVRYISELEHKVQTLESEATTLAAQLTLLQRDSAGLTNQNNELKFRLQAMEQQAHLRDALNEALSAEVKRLKLATGEYGGEVHSSNSSFSKHMFQMQHQQQQQREMSSDQTQDNSTVTKPDPDQ